MKSLCRRIQIAAVLGALMILYLGLCYQHRVPAWCDAPEISANTQCVSMAHNR